MKKILAALLIPTLLFALCACGGGSGSYEDYEPVDDTQYEEITDLTDSADAGSDVVSLGIFEEAIKGYKYERERESAREGNGVTINSIFYTITDVNSDGLKECVVSEDGENVAALYTDCNGTLSRVFKYEEGGQWGIYTDGVLFFKCEGKSLFEIADGTKREKEDDGVTRVPTLFLYTEYVYEETDDVTPSDEPVSNNTGEVYADTLAGYINDRLNAAKELGSEIEINVFSYCFKDIDGNGTEELIISEYDNVPCAAYTYVDGNVESLFFPERHGRYTITSDGYVVYTYKEEIIVYEFVGTAELKEFANNDDADFSDLSEIGVSSEPMQFTFIPYI